ncbi:MAG: penicillin-binding transpeptidase domain-containing protein [Miltoncostaeaceae bacterium]
MNRSIQRLFLVLVGGFALLVGMLGWWQVVHAQDLRDRQGNPQAAEAERLIDRGRIVSADGELLAASRARRVEGRRVYARVYPQRTLAAHVIGYSTSSQGKTGVEAVYDRFLTGSFGAEPLLQRLNLKEKRGANVQLTLDTRVQIAAEQALSGQKGAVVALDPRDGSVLAMASAPTFDLADVVGGRFEQITQAPDSPLINRATASRNAPGSTFKVVTAAAGLESGIYRPDSEFPGGDSYETPGGDIGNFGGRTFGRHDLTDALTNSINTTFAEIGDTLGADRMAEMMTAFGFGTRPAIDLPTGEVIASGRYQDGTIEPNAEQGEDIARLAIGQERLVTTPLQMAMVAAGVANGGVLMQPRLLSRVTDRSGAVVRTGEAVELGQPVSPQTAAELTEMMTDVVRDGTGTQAALVDVGVTVAGKTGTAETDDPALNNAWFIGFAPAENPTVAVAVVIEGTPGQGGSVAAPVAADVMRAALEAQ